MKYITFSTSIVLATIAAYFSIAGLTALFAGAVWSVVIMASALEIGKLVTAAYLHLEWKEINRLIRVYLVLAVGVLMLITSMGIFGYLSKAHIEQTVKVGGNNDIQIATLQRQIARQQDIIVDAETVLSQLDDSVQTLIDAQRIRGSSGSIAVREAQKEERASLNDTIADAYARIEELSKDLLPLQKEQLSLEAEVGPVKYIAEAVYGENYDVDTTIRMVILLLVGVFDPLAVVLLIVSTQAFKRDKLESVSKGLINSQQIMVMK